MGPSLVTDLGEEEAAAGACTSLDGSWTTSGGSSDLPEGRFRKNAPGMGIGSGPGKWGRAPASVFGGTGSAEGDILMLVPMNNWLT